jgi:hypothetical protein
VLAEDAPQVAMAEEDRSRPMPPAQTVFLSEMRERAGDDSVATCLARGPGIRQAIDRTIARAQTTLRERRDSCLRPLTQYLAAKIEIARPNNTHD